jgi:hypothetical protein
MHVDAEHKWSSTREHTPTEEFGIGDVDGFELLQR